MPDPGTLEAFNDFMYATREQPISSPDQIHNQASRHRTYLTRLMLAGLSEEIYFQSGKKIVEQLQLSYTPNARDYLPTDDQNPTGDNSLTQVEIPWRFTLVDSVWYDHEIILNDGGNRESVFKRLKKVKRQKMFTDLFDHIEDDLWAAPDKTQMEGGAGQGRKPYSLRCFITMGGGAPTAAADGAVNGDWTTIQTVNPTEYENYRNQVVTYDAERIDTALIDALDECWVKCKFEPPDDSGNTGLKETPTTKQAILTNLEGYKKLVKLARMGNNKNSPPANLGWANGKVYYNEMAIKYMSALDAICTAGQPRFYFVNFNHIRPIFNKKRYLHYKQFNGTVKQPMANVEYRDTYWNLVCLNRREQGIVRAA